MISKKIEKLIEESGYVLISEKVDNTFESSWDFYSLKKDIKAITRIGKNFVSEQLVAANKLEVITVATRADKDTFAGFLVKDGKVTGEFIEFDLKFMNPKHITVKNPYIKMYKSVEDWMIKSLLVDVEALNEIPIKVKNNDTIEISKFLSYYLRHNPKEIDIILDHDGWVGIAELIFMMRVSGVEINFDILNRIDKRVAKKRFEISADLKKIRATHGHSIKIKGDYKLVIPEVDLYHGTSSTSINKIINEGLKSMARNHVHLVSSMKEAGVVANRKNGKVVMLKVDVNEMVKDGFEFYVTKSGIYLSRHVPPKYLSIVEKWDY